MADEHVLDWLTAWYERHCDGRWEHRYGVNIQTLDNPGWRTTIDLVGTELETIAFDEVRHNHQEMDSSWWVCKRIDGVFRADCGIHDFVSVIGVFRGWAERSVR